MRLALEGIGIAAPFGTGLSGLTQALDRLYAGKWNLPPHPTTDTRSLKQFLPTRALRRTDHFTRIALLGAYQAIQDAGLDPAADDKDIGIVLATGYGPSVLTFDFLDSILEYGAAMSSPLAFAHSVHNIPAATIALQMQITGPCFTISQFESSVVAALLTARTWLAEGRVSHVLLGAVDEYCQVLENCISGLGPEQGGPPVPAGEGAVCFCIGTDSALASHGYIEDLYMGRAPSRDTDIPVLLSGKSPLDPRPAREYFFSTLYGRLPVAMALDIALATYSGLHPAVPVSPKGRLCCTSIDQFGRYACLTITPKRFDHAPH